MENHPIPQDVTGFKFRLIGSMTVKQFAYLLAAGIMSYIFYSSGIPFLIKAPFISLFVISGLSLAFVPIDGRPMDKMILNFIKAIPKENQFIYRRKGVSFLTQTIGMPAITRNKIREKEKIQEARTKKNILLSRLKRSYFKPDEIELDFINRIKPLLEESVIEKEIVYKNLETKQSPKKKEQENPQKEDKTIAIRPVLEQPKPEVEKPEMKEDLTKTASDLQKRLAEETREKELLQKKLFEIARTKPAEKVYKPIETKEEKETPNVKIISSDAAVKKAGFPVLPDIPNIVLGVIKDPRGKVLPNIIVEIVNAHNTPVRAFKTNALGQFISATPLPNGIYRVSFDDPLKQHEFDTIEITLKGEIFPPLEVISVDAREKLRRDLFEAST